MVNPILVALDVPSGDTAMDLARSLRSHVGGYKVGLELLMSEGPDLVATIGELELPIFVDAKLHDIPNTVHGAAKQLAMKGARWVTAHAAGGESMLEAAVSGLEEGRLGHTESGILAVTVLTSIEESDLVQLGIGGSLDDQVRRLAQLAQHCGVEGIVCSPNEVGIVRSSAPDLLRVTPGIRPGSVSEDDQKRVATPEDAIRAGADYIVIGRAITKASDPVEAARHIADSIGTQEPF